MSSESTQNLFSEQIKRSHFLALLILSLCACSSATTPPVAFPIAAPSAAEAPSPSPISDSPSQPESAAKSINVESTSPQSSGATTQQSAKSAKHQTGEAATTPKTPPQGSAAYYIPKQMTEKEASYVDLWIDRTTDLEQLKRELAARLQLSADRINMHRVGSTNPQSSPIATERIDSATIPIGDHMVAQLRGGEDFSIDPPGPISQPLKNTDRAKWNWRVTPKRASPDPGLMLDLIIWIDPGHDMQLIDSYQQRVVVEAFPVPWYEKLYKFAQEVNSWLTLLGIGGIAGVITWLSKKRSKTRSATRKANHAAG